MAARIGELVPGGDPSMVTYFSFPIRPNLPEEDFAGVRHSGSAEWAFPVKLTPNRPTSGWPVIRSEDKHDEAPHYLSVVDGIVR
jgi:hypothetical protein